MNPDRNQAYQIRECLRLASYLSDGERLYSDEEIAGRLGETLEWVVRILQASSGCKSHLTIMNPGNHLTNMIYDPGKRPVSNDQ